jgi:coniferyl-aldehyde dehydrogenase
MAEMFASRFDPTEVAVFTGGPEVAEAFSRLPFDHLLFTGATAIARHVMRAAAEHLVPVTLELGGKSPVLVGEGADLALTARRVMTGKTINAGQICLAPDYALVPEGRVEEFAAAAAEAVRGMYPSLKDNPDYTSVINQRHFERLEGYLDDARAKGARVIEINPAGEDFRQQPAHKLPPMLILDPHEDMKVMQEEIFGPLLPVKAYRRFEEAIDYVNARPRPLGLYYFGESRAEQEMVRARTTSGGVTINDVMAHAAIEDLPFGGVGPSGMGAYHGRDGFRRFSHAKAVSRQPRRLDLSALARPPYGRRIETAMRFVLRQ